MFALRPRSKGWAKALYSYIQFIYGEKNWPHADTCPGPLQTFKMESFLTIVYRLNIAAKRPIWDVCGGPDHASERRFCIAYATLL